MYYIGIDLGGTNIAAGLVDEEGRIVLKDSVPTLKGRSYEAIVKDMAMLVQKIINDAGVDIKEIKSIGIGCPGVMDSSEGVVVFANNLNFRYVPLRAEMQKYFSLPVFIDNDANVAAFAESVAGAAKGARYSIAITLGTGVGGGIIIDGKVYSGFKSAGAELGHMVIMVDGEQCTCGRKGCWEAYASATALIRQTIQAAKENPDSLINKLVDGDMSRIDAKTAFDAAKQGDETGKKVVEKYIGYIAEGLTNIMNIFSPEVVVIGGGVCKEGEYLLKPLREKVAASVYSPDVLKPDIRVAQMGNDAGIVGAAMLGRDA